jgi:hypothetical protein
VYLLGILPISSVRMRPRAGFRAFSYNACSTATELSPAAKAAAVLAERPPQCRGWAAPIRKKEIHS